MTGQTPAEEFDHFSGLLQTPPDPLRYDYPPDGPEEAHQPTPWARWQRPTDEVPMSKELFAAEVRSAIAELARSPLVIARIGQS